MELGEGMEHVETMHINDSRIDAQLCPANIETKGDGYLTVSSEQELFETYAQSQLVMVKYGNTTSVCKRNNVFRVSMRTSCDFDTYTCNL